MVEKWGREIASVFEFVKLLARDTSSRIIYECRRCGTTLDGEDADCPYCGPAPIVRFEL